MRGAHRIPVDEADLVPAVERLREKREPLRVEAVERAERIGCEPCARGLRGVRQARRNVAARGAGLQPVC